MEIELNYACIHVCVRQINGSVWHARPCSRAVPCISTNLNKIRIVGGSCAARIQLYLQLLFRLTSYQRCFTRQGSQSAAGALCAQAIMHSQSMRNATASPARLNLHALALHPGIFHSCIYIYEHIQLQTALRANLTLALLLPNSKSDGVSVESCKQCSARARKRSELPAHLAPAGA